MLEESNVRSVLKPRILRWLVILIIILITAYIVLEELAITQSAIVMNAPAAGAVPSVVIRQL